MGEAIIVLVILFIAVAVVLLSRVIFAGSVSFIKAKTKSVSATVLNKRKQDMLRSSGIYTNYFILFDLGDGDRIEMPVSKRLWRKSPIGTNGTLTYKGEFFISFRHTDS